MTQMDREELNRTITRAVSLLTDLEDWLSEEAPTLSDRCGTTAERLEQFQIKNLP